MASRRASNSLDAQVIIPSILPARNSQSRISQSRRTRGRILGRFHNSSERQSGKFPVIDDLIAVSDTEFEEKVLQSSLPVIVDLWAPRCGPSNRIAPVLEEIANRIAGKLIVAKVNTDEDREWAIKYCVQRIPTMLFFQKGASFSNISGRSRRPIYWN